MPSVGARIDTRLKTASAAAIAPRGRRVRFGLRSIDFDRLLDTLRPQPFDLLACLDDLAACGCKIGLDCARLADQFGLVALHLRDRSGWSIPGPEALSSGQRSSSRVFSCFSTACFCAFRPGNQLVKRFHALVQNILLGFKRSKRAPNSFICSSSTQAISHRWPSGQGRLRTTVRGRRRVRWRAARRSPKALSTASSDD